MSAETRATRRLFRLTLVVALVSHAASPLTQEESRPSLQTRWSAEAMSAQVPLGEYPRPQFVRSRWTNLNGLWDYAIESADSSAAPKWQGKIRVPFAVESALSGIEPSPVIGAGDVLWYRRTFAAPKLSAGERLLLHFGAVDWEARVWLNGVELGQHQGGYDAFSFDVTDELHRNGDQEVVVRVWDPTDAGYQPRGKQVSDPRGIWYTAVTGIWQTVWLEPVPALSLATLAITPDAAHGRLRLLPTLRGAASASSRVEVVARAGAVAVGRGAGAPGEVIEIVLDEPREWSPEAPFLYELEVRLLRGDEVIDSVESYFGLRDIAVGKDMRGQRRIMLNGEPLFLLGQLDQGWWPDGLYTAPTDAALRYDIEVMKQLGFNAVRKHVKVEPDRWYYWADRLGILVLQDMPSGDEYIGRRDPDIERTAQSRRAFYREWGAVIRALANHPSIVIWVPFNEGWGQFETDRVIAWTRQRDPTRLVNSPSGWADRGSGDIVVRHAYPGPTMFPTESYRASFLGEFGGLGLPLDGHLWRQEGSWGYRGFDTREELEAAYVALVELLPPLYGRGLAGAIYTQTTDVEIEVNGLMTYDREVIKLDPAVARAAHAPLFAAPPVVRDILPSSEATPRSWRFVTTAPATDWYTTTFDDSGWNLGNAGFGAGRVGGARARALWESPVIWLRQRFEIDDELPPGRLHLRIHHDEDVEVWLNGEHLLTREGVTNGYVDVPLAEDARQLLRGGANVIAVRCQQTEGGQYIDVGLSLVEY